MRTHFFSFTLLALLLLPSSVAAEYAELTALKQGSRRALQQYAADLPKVEKQFAGVIAFGRSLAGVEIGRPIDIAGLTYKSKNYWRAVLEMAPQDPSILFAHAHLHAILGETSHASIYFILGSLTMAPEFRGLTDKYFELYNALEKRANADIDRGIALNDSHHYKEAIRTYDAVLAKHPNSQRAYYEKGLSYVLMETGNPQYEKIREEMNASCRARDPFYLYAYQGSDKNVLRKMQSLSKKVLPFFPKPGQKRTIASFVDFAEGCEEMDLYPLAAHARWKLVLLDADNASRHLKKFLVLIEKSGCQDADFFRRQFNLKAG